MARCLRNHRVNAYTLEQGRDTAWTRLIQFVFTDLSPVGSSKGWIVCSIKAQKFWKYVKCKNKLLLTEISRHFHAVSKLPLLHNMKRWNQLIVIGFLTLFLKTYLYECRSHKCVSLQHGVQTRYFILIHIIDYNNCHKIQSITLSTKLIIFDLRTCLSNGNKLKYHKY